MKKCFISMAVVLLVLLIIIFVGVILSRTVMDTYDSCEDMERMQSGGNEILFDVYEMTPESFMPWFEAVLTVPQRVRFGLDDADFSNNQGTNDVVYLLEDPTVSVLAMELFVDKELVVSDVPIYELRSHAKGGVDVSTLVGGVALYFDENGFTYVLSSGANGYSVFTIEEDLQAEWETIWQEIEPYCWPDKEDSFSDTVMTYYE